MQFYSKIFCLLGISIVHILPEQTVLSNCGKSVISQHAACLWTDAKGNCPHGMLKLDTNDDSYADDGSQSYERKACLGAYGVFEKVYNSKNKETRSLFTRACCLLTSSNFNVKIKDTPCTSGK